MNALKKLEFLPKPAGRTHGGRIWISSIKCGVDPKPNGNPRNKSVDSYPNHVESVDSNPNHAESVDSNPRHAESVDSNPNHREWIPTQDTQTVWIPTQTAWKKPTDEGCGSQAPLQ